MLKNKWFMFSLALFVIPFALNLVFYSQLPDVVPTHFDVNGKSMEQCLSLWVYLVCYSCAWQFMYLLVL